MCFKKPKPKPVLPDPELARANAEARLAAQIERSDLKRERTEDNLAQLNGFGRTSLLSGGRGGRGYAAPQARSLFVTA